MPGPVTVRVPAKINLHLGVGALREDRFHEVTTVYQAVSLYDEVSVAPAEELSVTVSGLEAGQVPADDDNLAAAAARALATFTGTAPDVAVRICKGIPVAGGMAGGSGDAAATLVACDALWGTAVERDDLLRLAADLGSDVPFALFGGTALGFGRGEHLTPVLGRGSYAWVLAFAETGLSTPAVYGEFDRMRETEVPAPESSPHDVLGALRSGDPTRLGRTLSNDLEPPALRLRPALRRVLDAGREEGALGALVSGSGPTCVFLARSDAHAVDVAARLSGHGVCRTVRRATGPVPGARVVEPGRD